MRRILLYRGGFLGDVVMSMPAVRLVRQHNPDARITYATFPPCDELVEYCLWVDDVVRAGTYYLRDYDAVCHFEHEEFGREKTYWGALHIRNAQSAGLVPNSSESVPNSSELRPIIWLSAEKKPTVDLPEQYFVVHTHSTNGLNWRLWSVAKWGLLLDRVKGKTGLPAVLLGTAKAPSIRGATIDLRGRHSVMQDVWTVAGAKFTICIDSFIAHVSHAQKLVALDNGGYVAGEAVPCVLLNGPIPKECIVPSGAKCVVVSQYQKCGRGGPCGRSHGQKRCEYKNVCMGGLTVDEAWAGVEKLLTGLER